MKLSSLVANALAAVTLVLPLASAQAQNTNYGPGVSWGWCSPDEVAVFPNRVHIRCGNILIYGGYSYYAVPVSSSAEAARLIALATAAMSPNRSLHILANMQDTSAASFGCAAHDCRRPLEIRLERPLSQ